MPLQIAPALEADMPKMMAVQFSAFDGELYHQVLYPGGNTDTGRAAAGVRVLKEWRQEQPHLQIGKCTDSETGMLIGFVKWEFYERERGEEESRKEEEEEIDWCEGRTKELAELFLGKTYGLRRRIWGGKRHALCALLCVHADHQRRGAGTLLTQWGLDHAEKVGLPAYLEASVYGYSLYQKLGFHDIDKVLIKAEEWGGDYDKVYIAMLKEPLKNWYFLTKRLLFVAFCFVEEKEATVYKKDRLMYMDERLAGGCATGAVLGNRFSGSVVPFSVILAVMNGQICPEPDNHLIGS